MNYEVVELKAKTIVGKSIVTSNSDPKMGEKIGGLWAEMYDPETGYFGSIENKSGNTAIGLYSDYTADGQYTVTVGAEVDKADNPGMAVKRTASGKYAKFSVHGNMVTAVAEAWGEIWKTPLERTYTGDFEEYLPCTDCGNTDNCGTEKCEECDINIYVAVK